VTRRNKFITASVSAGLLVALGYTVVIVERANDSFGWFYLDIAEPRDQAQYQHLLAQYNQFNQEPWKRIPIVSEARLRAEGALALYHYDKLTTELRQEILADAQSQPLRQSIESRITTCITYKFAQNGFVTADPQRVDQGKRDWSTIHEAFGSVPIPPVH
jgi:hypothetical protein